jgi:hypothetical protein
VTPTELLRAPRLRLSLVAALAMVHLTACGGGFAMADAAAPTTAEPMREEMAGGEMSKDARGPMSYGTTPTGGIDLAKAAPAPMEPGLPPPAPPPPPPPGMPIPQPQPDGPAARAGAGAERPDAVVIYTAELTVAVFEVQKSIEEVAAIARAQGGFMARRDDRSITIRVPAGRFDGAVKELEAIGDVLHRNVTAEDVSEEFHDLQIQLRTLQAMRERLVVLLGKAQKVEEAIAVERELGRVSGEIDRIQGRLKFLADRAALSTITVRLEPRQPEGVGKGPFQVPLPWIHDLGISRLINL